MSDHDEEYFEEHSLDSGDETEDSSEPEEIGDGDDLFVDGFDILTHGGGELEHVEGFNLSHPMVEGIGNEDITPVEPNLSYLPRSCDLEFGEEQQESVCGRDDRVEVSVTTKVPWRMICQLIITRRDGQKSRCTGWFIARRTVMTAGHCVFSHKGQKGWAQSIEVIPGMKGNLRPFGSSIGSSFRSVTGWTRKRKATHDYGCIILPKNTPLGDRTGWWGFAALSNSSLHNLLANNSGYPGDKPFGTQWYNAGRITRVDKRRFQYMLDTAGGQSGSPTWRYKGGKRHVIGIHAYGGCPNKSTRITQAVYNRMKGWRQLGM